MPLPKPITRLVVLLPALLLGLATGLARGQGVIPVGTLPRIVVFKPGAYQLANGGWQPGQLFLEATGQLRVRQPDSKVATTYGPGEVTAFVLEADTFGVVRGVALTARRRLSAVFAQRLYHYGQMTAYKLDYRFVNTGASLATYGPGGSDLVVQPATGDAVIVPAGRGSFTQAMLPLVGSCPALADQIAKGKLGRQHTRQILQTYARWQQTTAEAATN
ncbi:hypothetical protein [Hymenobacter rubripertinctus]|uniref:Uncharacterized protein n=1 Tax=Hymenobacter rubripertinctus TaxID=2029981 RepID=A0A418QKI3_9BACT|nr:hypothetical protein [Hymenobacter rubripertinctus]RIY05620.1 hypothetical protein D0T11_20090 [Hymenobacter rubripertinctus]